MKHQLRNFARNTAKTFGVLALGFTAILGGGSPAHASDDMAGKFSNGFKWENKEKGHELKLGGRLMGDWSWVSDMVRDDTEFRRARLYLAGKIYGAVEFKMQHDWASGSDSFKDMYFGIVKGLPTKIRFGQQYEPIGLETLTSSNYVTFMERSVATHLHPERNIGILVHDSLADGMFGYQAGIFRNSSGVGNAVDTGDDASYNYDIRLFASPFYESDGEQVVHVGASYSLRHKPGDVDLNEIRPENHLAPKLFSQDPAGQATIPVQNVHLINFEAAVVFQMVSVQGEYTLYLLDAVDSTDPDLFQSFYVQASVFLTGEHRGYKRKGGVFDKVKVKEAFPDGFGAVEVAARFSRIDLDDNNASAGSLGSVPGSTGNSFTGGLNWYINTNTRIMFNYVFVDVDGIDGGAAGGTSQHNVMARAHFWI